MTSRATIYRCERCGRYVGDGYYRVMVEGVVPSNACEGRKGQRERNIIEPLRLCGRCAYAVLNALDVYSGRRTRDNRE